MKLNLTISPIKIALILTGVSVYMAAQSLIMKHIEWAAGTNSTYWIYHITQLVNVNREANIPTYYSALLLLACALLLGIITYVKRANQGRYVFHWGMLSIIFLYLSIDEATAIHEIFTVPIQDTLGVTGYLYFGWVVVGFAFVISVGLLYLKFLFHLPPPHRWRFMLAGAVYVGGALGVEAISANLWYLDDGTSLTFSTVATLEELMEMMGTVIFIYALLLYIREHVTEISMTFSPAQHQHLLDEPAQREEAAVHTPLEVDVH